MLNIIVGACCVLAGVALGAAVMAVGYTMAKDPKES